MSSHNGGAGQGGLAGVFRSPAGLLALCATIFVAPQIWPLVGAGVARWLNQLYSPNTATWLLLGGEIITWPLTFLALRAGLMAGFMVITVLITKRLM